MDWLASMSQLTVPSSGTFRMNVALSALPSFTALPGEGDHLSAGIILAPSLDYMDRAWRDARDHGWSREPIVEMLIPSTLDDSLASPGMHVASLFCQHVAPELPGGRPGGGGRSIPTPRPICVTTELTPCSG